MNSKITFLFTFIFICFCSIGYAQKDININENALKHFNSYLSYKSIIDDTKGELIFDRYSNSLNYSSTFIMYVDPTTEKDIYSKISVKFPIPLNHILKIEESILRNNASVIFSYKFYLDINVKRIIQSKTKGEWLDEKIVETNEVWFSPAQKFNSSDIERMQLVIRDIFPDVTIESETINYKE